MNDSSIICSFSISGSTLVYISLFSQSLSKSKLWVAERWDVNIRTWDWTTALSLTFLMLRLSRSLSRFTTQDIKTQPMNQPLYTSGWVFECLSVNAGFPLSPQSLKKAGHRQAVIIIILSIAFFKDGEEIKVMVVIVKWRDREDDEVGRHEPHHQGLSPSHDHETSPLQ